VYRNHVIISGRKMGKFAPPPPPPPQKNTLVTTRSRKEVNCSIEIKLFAFDVTLEKMMNKNHPLHKRRGNRGRKDVSPQLSIKFLDSSFQNFP
jgi:hypothetical protein